MDNQDFIAGIYNYCDRWCERCPFTRRCRHFMSFSDEDIPDITSENFWDSLVESFDRAMRIVQNHIEAQGMDWEEFKSEALIEEVLSPSLTTEQQSLDALTKTYYMQARKWFGEHEFLFEKKGVELTKNLKLGIDVLPEAKRINEATEIIKQYLFFISSKVHRAIHSTYSRWPEEDEVQNDANGSAKIALIAVQRSLGAWEIVRSTFPDYTDDMLEIFVLLGKIQQQIQRQFPRLEEFVRPGFDEIPSEL